MPFQLVTLENDENRMPLVQAELNGIPVSLVVDTGASHTCIDRSAFKRCTVSRPDSPGRLAPAGGSLYGIPVCLLDLLHRTAIVFLSPASVNTPNNERTMLTNVRAVL